MVPTRQREIRSAPTSIPVPSRLSGLDAVLVILAAATLTVFPFARWLAPWQATILLGLALVGWRRNVHVLVSLAAFGALLVGAASADRLMSFWPLPALVATVGLLLLSRLPTAKVTLPFFARGVMDGKACVLIVTSALVAGVALVGWFVTAAPDYAAVRTTLFPALPAPLLLVGVSLFGVVNAALEEVAYRGLLLQALDAALGTVSIVIQAIAFGALHIGGFPRGAAGVVLATIFGLMMGTIRRRTRGLLAPWVAHVLADVTIGAILIATR